MNRVLLPLAVLTASAAAAALWAVSASGHSSGAQTFTIDVDGKNPKANEAFLAYYPSTVRLHAGDAVVFHEAGNGEPHTVTLGTLVDPAVAAYDKLTPAQQQGTPPKSFLALDARIPSLFPQGAGDAVQSAANPCYLASGSPPKSAACPKTAAQPFDGTQSFYNSGWLDSNAKWTIHLSSSTAPGTYHFMCLLHREGMSGNLVVVPSGTSVPSPQTQFAAGQKKLRAAQATLASALVALRQGKPPIPSITLPGENVVLAGSGNPGSPVPAAITEFGKSKISIPVGGSVIWYLIGPHSVTFNSNKTNDDIRLVAPDGSVHINPKAASPAGGPGEPATPPKPGKAPITFKVVAKTSWNGKGFLNSGVFGNSDPPVIEGYQLTFTRAGKYKYICTVHDDMKGEVDVG
jgi:plastocyanin